jgi:hypothetical protein
MAARKRKSDSRSSEKKKGAPRSSVLQSKNPRGISIGEFEIDSINAFREFSFFNNLIIFTCGLIVIIAIMIQIRFARNNVPHSTVDRLPSYKFYKARYLKTTYTKSVVIVLAMYSVLPWLDTNMVTLENSMIQHLNTGVESNSPYIEKPNSNNYQMYFYGVISRMLGLLNSCPASNHQIFNFPSAVKDANMETILKLVPFPESSKPSVDEMIGFLREVCLKEDNPTFEEDALPGDSGLTPLELQIFGDVMSRKPAVSNRLTRGSILPNNALTHENLASVLSPVELAQYDLSAKHNPARLKELTSIAIERFNSQKAAQREQSSNPAPVASPTALPPAPAVNKPQENLASNAPTSETEKAPNPVALPAPVSPSTLPSSKKKPGRPRKTPAAEALKRPPLPLPAVITPPAQPPLSADSVPEAEKKNPAPEVSTSASTVDSGSAKPSDSATEAQNKLGEPSSSASRSGAEGNSDAGNTTNENESSPSPTSSP